MVFTLGIAALAALGVAQTAPPPALAQARIGTLLSGKPIRILDAERGTFDHSGIVTSARVDGCDLVLANSGLEPASLTVPLGDLRFVQGDSGMVEITRIPTDSPSIIFTVGDAAYDETINLLTEAATGCGAHLIGPPALLMTR